VALPARGTASRKYAIIRGTGTGSSTFTISSPQFTCSVTTGLTGIYTSDNFDCRSNNRGMEGCNMRTVHGVWKPHEQTTVSEGALRTKFWRGAQERQPMSIAPQPKWGA
jgi:hypothetical protein